MIQTDNVVLSENLESSLVAVGAALDVAAGALASATTSMPAEWRTTALGISAVIGVVGTSILAYWKAKVNKPKA